MTERDNHLLFLANFGEVDWKAEYLRLHAECERLEQHCQELYDDNEMRRKFAAGRAVGIAEKVSEITKGSVKVTQELWVWDMYQHGDPDRHNMKANIFANTYGVIGEADTLEGAYAAAQENLKKICVVNTIAEPESTSNNGVTADAT